MYAGEKTIPAWVAAPLIGAFLVEYSFYLVPGFETLRIRLQQCYRPRNLALILSCTALLPYVIYSVGTGQFQWIRFAGLAALVSAVSFWYVLVQPSALADLALLGVLAAVVLFRVPGRIYTSPLPGLKVEMLGQLMLIRLGAMVMLVLRGVRGVGFGFLPGKEECKVGIRNFVYFVPVGFVLLSLTRIAQFHPAGIVWWKVLGTLLAIFWVVALAEEFFFRGLLQQWLQAWMGSPHAALALVSALFGLCHLWFRGFPNWRFAALAAAAGWFYGRAYNQARSIRASMVTHALVVTTWRVLFK